MTIKHIIVVVSGKQEEVQWVWRYGQRGTLHLTIFFSKNKSCIYNICDFLKIHTHTKARRKILKLTVFKSMA